MFSQNEAMRREAIAVSELLAKGFHIEELPDGSRRIVRYVPNGMDVARIRLHSAIPAKDSFLIKYALKTKYGT